jgi:putative glutamine amidotransferase
MAMPLIGLAPGAHTTDYEASLLRTGATFRVLDPMHDDPVASVRQLDGILLTGGGDVDPALFGEAAHATYHPAEAGRDAHEIALVRAAVDAHLPMLAICRGLQVMNVACGGTLLQDIPSSVPPGVDHQVPMPKNAMVHEVWMNRGSLLWRVLSDALDGGDTCTVNSRHHQAVRDLADGFVVSATAPDGVIEAIERDDAPFCLGVQWHPENFWRTGEFRGLFEALVRAAAQHRA